MTMDRVRKVEGLIRSVLNTTNQNKGCKVDSLPRLYESIVGERLDHRALGFPSLEALLRTMPRAVSLHVTERGLWCRPVHTESSQNLGDLKKEEHRRTDRPRRRDTHPPRSDRFSNQFPRGDGNNSGTSRRSEPRGSNSLRSSAGLLPTPGTGLLPTPGTNRARPRSTDATPNGRSSVSQGVPRMSEPRDADSLSPLPEDDLEGPTGHDVVATGKPLSSVDPLKHIVQFCVANNIRYDLDNQIIGDRFAFTGKIYVTEEVAWDVDYEGPLSERNERLAKLSTVLCQMANCYLW